MQDDEIFRVHEGDGMPIEEAERRATGRRSNQVRAESCVLPYLIWHIVPWVIAFAGGAFFAYLVQQ